MKQNRLTGVAMAILVLCNVALKTVRGAATEQVWTSTVGTTAGSTAQTKSRLAEQSRIVQESSRRIAELVHLRPGTITPNEAEALVQQRIDDEIAVIRQERAKDLEALVLADNHRIELIDQERAIYRVPVNDSDGQSHWFSGRIPAIWHLHQLDPAVFTLAESIRSQPQAAELPKDTRVEAHLLVGGTSAQSKMQPFPGDIDYNETFFVHAPTPAAAGEAMATIVVELVTRTSTDPRLEFDALRIMPLKSRREPETDYKWPAARVLDPTQQSELARQLASVDSGRANTDWRALVADERYIVIGKILGIQALSSISGERFFATEPLRLDFQVLYFGDKVPVTHRDTTLGNYAAHMLDRVSRRVRRGQYLKAAKRTFNFCRATGDLECIVAVTPIFATPEAKVYHHYKVLEAIAMALDPETPSRILTATNARKQLNEAATVIEAKLPVVAGTIPERPQGVAHQLRVIAKAIRARSSDPVGIVEPDANLAQKMHTLLDVELIPIIRLSLKDRVETIVDTYIP